MRVTFGKYIPTNSIIHKMDPRLKLAMIIFLIVAVFFPIGFTGYIVLTAIILTLFAASKVSWRMLSKLLIPVLFIFIVIFLINIFLMHPSAESLNIVSNNIPFSDKFWIVNHGAYTTGFISYDAFNNIPSDSNVETTNAIGQMITMGHFIHIGPVWLSEKATYTAIIMGLRIYLMITLTTILTASTQPLQLTLAIEDLLWPLKLIGIPVYIISMIISIALRMIPTLIDEAGRIMKAQASRGIDIKNGKIKDKAKGLTSLIIPLLVSAFQKAEDLAFAMDARGYDPRAKRTRFIQFSLNWVDIMIFLIGVASSILLIVYSIEFPLNSSTLHLPYIDRIIA